MQSRNEHIEREREVSRCSPEMSTSKGEKGRVSRCSPEMSTSKGEKGRVSRGSPEMSTSTGRFQGAVQK